jgi:hypothetical protein
MSGEFDTQVLQDDPQLDPNDPGGNESDPAGGAPAEPFFQLNDRQVYKTREDLAKSMNEAAKVAASYSEIKKAYKEFGIEPDPKLTRQLLSELVTHRSKATAPAAKANESTAPNAKATVDPKVEEARKWLTENAGMVTKDQYDALVAKLDELKGGLTAREEESRNALISEGQEAVSGWLKDAKTSDGKPVELNDDERNELEETIAAWLGNGQSPTSIARLERFYKGGNTSIAVIKEAYAKVLPVVKPGTIAFPNPASKIAASGKTKTELINRTPKRMPNDSGTPAANAKDKAPMRIGDPRLHHRVTEKLKRLLAEGSGGGDE